jgi:ribose transport system ATP-binding protein
MGGFVRPRALRGLLSEIIKRLDIRPANGEVRVEHLSGGNQQKVVLGRALTRKRAVYIFDEPTAGIDVAARLEFYKQLKGLCESGAAILLITSDLQELIHLSHRIYVMHAGEIAAELTGEDRTDENVVRYAFG